MVVGNYAKLWAWQFNIFWCNISTHQSNVRHFCYCMKCPIINMFHNIVTNVGSMLFVVPFVHCNGVWWMAKWDTSCIHCHWKKLREWFWPNSLSTIKTYAKHLDA
jgi:hypothetical protein